MNSLNSLSPNSEENEMSLYIITTCSNIQVMRIKKVTTKDKLDVLIFRQILLTTGRLYFHKICMENSKENMHFYIRA